MAKAASKNKEMQVLEVDQEEIPLEQTIENTLVKHKFTPTVISALKQKYSNLALRDLNDKETYLEIKAARKEARSWGILVENLCKAGRQKAIEVQRLWLSKEKECLNLIAEVENPLQAEIDKYDKEQERLELEEIRKRENAFAARQSELIKMGATYLDGSYSLNHISFEADTIKSADQDIWESSILSKFKTQYEKNEAARIEEERKRAEAAESLRVAQEAMAAKEKEMQEREAALLRAENERLAAIRQANEEADRIKRLEQQRAEDERREKNRQRVESRANQLRALGMSFNFQYDAYVFEDVNIDNKTELCLWSDEEWDAKIKEITPVIEDRKRSAERRKEEAQKEQLRIAEEAAAQRERDRIAEEQRLEREKAEREAQLKAEEALKASDKQKWASFTSAINSVIIPDTKSPTYRAKVAEAVKLIHKIINL